VLLRDLQDSDILVITALNNANTPAVNDKTAGQMGDMIGAARWAIGAFDDEQLLGFLITFLPGAAYASLNFAWFSANYRRFAYMDRIVVDPGQRNRGVGVALYEHLFSSIGGTEPFVGIDVNVRPANDGSLRFHQRLGFREVHRQDTDGGNKTVALMIKTLDGRP
jgi:uncharacterized protein